MRRLRLAKGYNQGIEGGTLYTLDDNGDATIFDLTDYTPYLEIYDSEGTVQATITGQVDDADAGVYSIIPYVTDVDMSDLEELDDGEYLYRIKVTSDARPEGRLFDVDSEGRPLRCTII